MKKLLGKKNKDDDDFYNDLIDNKIESSISLSLPPPPENYKPYKVKQEIIKVVTRKENLGLSRWHIWGGWYLAGFSWAILIMYILFGIFK